jgi:hypothetical protein
MSDDPTLRVNARPVYRRWAGTATLAGVVLFLATVITLHAVQPGYDPQSQLMSELALGAYGGFMLLAFAGLSLSALGVLLGLPSGAPLLKGLLGAASASFLAAGVFPLGDTSEIHIAAMATAFVLSVLAMYLFPATAGLAAGAGPRLVSWPLAAGVALSVVLGHSVLPMGIGQRLAALCLVAWFSVVAWRMRNRRPVDTPSVAEPVAAK